MKLTTFILILMNPYLTGEGGEHGDALMPLLFVVGQTLHLEASKLPDSGSVPCSGGVVRTAP